MKVLKLFSSMAKIGVIGFGGGNALIPIIHKNIVEEEGLVSQEEYEEDVLVASITPGALPVEIAGGIGRRLAGWKGMMAGSVGMAFPGVFLTILLLSFLTELEAGLVRQVSFLTVGITAFIVCMLTDYVIQTMKRADNLSLRLQYGVIILGVFTLTGEKNLYRLFGIDRIPVFGLSTINVFLTAFFLIFIYSIFQRNRQFGQEIRFWGIVEMGKEVCMLLFFVVLTGIFAYFVAKNVVDYLRNGLLSSLMSFGGGDAYLTVAEGLFVESGFITEDIFYGSIVPLVNILPGSVLCKTLSAVGYFIGFVQSGSIWGGYIVAIAGFFTSIAGSCGVISVVGWIYRMFGEIPVFRLIKKWIRPIVSGLMLNVMLSLVYQARKIGIAENMGWMPVVVMVVIYGINMFLYYKKRINNVIMVLVSVGMSWVLCNLG